MKHPPHAPGPGRRTVLVTGAGAAAALLTAPPPASASAGGPASAGGFASAPAPPEPGIRPYAAYWFPDSLPDGSPDEGIVWRSLADWRPEDDADLPFHTASVPLARRFTPVAGNATARRGQARISALAAFGNTAGNPAQGGPGADTYAPTHWAYLDELVFWGGSAAEGLILAPTAPVVDAAHRNGVPVLGTVFLPPVHHGGDLRWTRDLVRRDSSGGYPLADQLARVATAYGFDGWFVNAETEGGDAGLGARMRGFLHRLRALSDARGLRVTWYDAMTTDGEVAWQGALNDRNQAFFQDAGRRVSDSLFVDFRWTPSRLAASGDLADRIGRDRYELWAGVDVQENGRHTDVDWDAILPEAGPHVVSYGFYRPDWTFAHLPEDRTPGQFHAADDQFWSGPALDPAAPGTPGDGSGWRAPAAAVADRSTVDALPFATTFNTGHGLRWYEEGRVTGGEAWHHLGLQDRLPARRWEITGAGSRRPDVSFDFADAWRGGSSLLVTGSIDGPTVLGLYGTRLPLSPSTVVELTHRTDDGSAGIGVELAVALREPERPGDPVPYVYLPAGTLRPGGSRWTTATVRVGRLLAGSAELPDAAPDGRSTGVRALGVRLTPDGGGAVAWRLGALAVRDATTTPAAPADLRITAAAAGPDGTGLRLAWRAAPAGAPVRQYALHRVLPDGTRRFLGGTCQQAYYVAGLRPAPGERAARLELTAVGELYTASPPVTTTHPWTAAARTSLLEHR